MQNVVIAVVIMAFLALVFAGIVLRFTPHIPDDITDIDL
jgi:hypothetical protein